MQKEQIIQRGAEAILIKKENLVLKRRIAKGYRFPQLDEKLRKTRTRSEAKILEKIAKIIPVPKVLKINEKEKEIEMDFVLGLKLSESLDKLKNWKEVCAQIGEGIARLHDAGIIHGDLTTSNLIWVGENKKVYFIDFGLGFHSNNAEDKAVDLHLIKQALEAKHFGRWQDYFNMIIESYRRNSVRADEVLKRLEKVERRGRYKQNY